MLHGAITPRAELSAHDVDAMHALMVRHYDGVVRDKFLADLAEKDGALVLRDPTGAIHGFSTYFVQGGLGPTGPYRVLFSGDTIVDARSWGHLTTLRLLGTLFARLLADEGDPLYWLLLSKGVRTYLLLPLLFRHFSPGGGRPAGAPERALLCHLAARRYGAQFHPASSLLKPHAPADRLKPQWSGVSPARQANPHVRFFLERNPGHAAGDELVSLAHVAPANLTAAGHRLVRPGEFCAGVPRAAAGGGD